MRTCLHYSLIVFFLRFMSGLFELFVGNAVGAFGRGTSSLPARRRAVFKRVPAAAASTSPAASVCCAAEPLSACAPNSLSCPGSSRSYF